MSNQHGFGWLEVLLVTAMAVVVAAIIAAAVTKDPGPHRYRLQDGRVITCKTVWQSNAGVVMKGCDGGSSYYGVTNVEELP